MSEFSEEWRSKSAGTLCHEFTVVCELDADHSVDDVCERVHMAVGEADVPYPLSVSIGFQRLLCAYRIINLANHSNSIRIIVLSDTPNVLAIMRAVAPS